MQRLLALLIVCFAAPLAAQTSSYEELQRFSDVLNHVRSNYVDSVTYRQLLHSAIDGMLRSLDPHSWYLTSEDNARFNALERGELATTGTTIELADGVPTVITVTDNSPADHAGVRAGDRIMAVDKVPTAGQNARAISLRMAGAKGTKVVLLIERGPRLEPDSVSVTIKRDAPKPETFISSTQLLDNSTGYVKLSEFGAKSAKELHDAFAQLKDGRATQVILDLRGNPGGIVIEAVEMAKEFLPNNSLVFTTRGRQKSANAEYRTKGNGDFQGMPLVVLIDQGSASAAEALAGSLQDNDRAVIAGRRSFGKALMQTSFLVSDGLVMLTIGHVIAPSGRYIQRPYTGLQLEQYYAFAGDSSWVDPNRIFHTVHGRPVKGGGGIAPDVALPAPPIPPRWWTVAADSGWDQAVADSVALTLGTDKAARSAWINGADQWQARLLPPLLARVRSRLHVGAEPDAMLSAFMARKLAGEAAQVRWDADAQRELMVKSDRDVIAAKALFARGPEILGRH